MNNFKTILMTSVLTTLAAGNVYAAEEIKPSFDCAKAKTRVEKLICSDVKLAKLDRKMSSEYRTLMSDKKLDGELKEILKNNQKKWLDSREKTPCLEKEDFSEQQKCIKHIYGYRIKKLTDTKKGLETDLLIESPFTEKHPADYTFVSLNGEEIGMDFISTEPVTATVFPTPEEELILCSSSFIKNAYTHRLLERTDKRIVFWAGNAWENADGTFQDAGPKEYSEKTCLKSRINSYPPKYATPEESVKWYKNSINKEFTLYTMRGVTDLSTESRIKNCILPMSLAQKKKMKIIKKYITANSLYELKKKSGVACTKEKIKQDYDDWYPPYVLYELDDNTKIFGGAYNDSPGSSVYSFLHVDNDCTPLEKRLAGWHIRNPVILAGEEQYRIFGNRTLYTLDNANVECSFAFDGCGFTFEKGKQK